MNEWTKGIKNITKGSRVESTKGNKNETRNARKKESRKYGQK
jgi:hypothetical protein